MKAKFALPLALTLASTSALAAANQTSIQNNSVNYAEQQFQNMNNGTGILAGIDWFHRIRISGLLALDGYFQTNQNYLDYKTTTLGTTNTKVNSESDFTIGEGVLNIDGRLTNWANAHISLFYADKHQPMGVVANANGSYNVFNIDNRTFATTRYYVNGDTFSGVDFDEAYIDLGNFADAPFMLRVGRQYLPFGQYDRYAMMPSVTQQLTETRASALELAYVSRTGFHSAAYAFRGIAEQSRFGGDHNSNIINGGISFGYTNLQHRVGFDIGSGYLYNMFDVGNIAFAHLDIPYSKHIGGIASHATLMTGPFSLGIKYVSSLGGGFSGIGSYTDNNGTSEQRPEPDAGNVFFNYNFKSFGYNSKLNLSYQWTDQAFTSFTFIVRYPIFSMPKNRAQVQYDIDLFPHTDLGLLAAYDTAYDRDHNGTGDNNFTGMARLSVML